ncbi:hypothetical protein QJQ45_001630 [Haematococcus lacustris]|nr:hypothetical protein QJQ45_001630 [Haematococcus lacustris]
MPCSWLHISLSAGPHQLSARTYHTALAAPTPALNTIPAARAHTSTASLHAAAPAAWARCPGAARAASTTTHHSITEVLSQPTAASTGACSEHSPAYQPLASDSVAEVHNQLPCSPPGADQAGMASPGACTPHDIGTPLTCEAAPSSSPAASPNPAADQATGGSSLTCSTSPTLSVQQARAEQVDTPAAAGDAAPFPRTAAADSAANVAGSGATGHQSTSDADAGVTQAASEQSPPRRSRQAGGALSAPRRRRAPSPLVQQAAAQGTPLLPSAAASLYQLLREEGASFNSIEVIQSYKSVEGRVMRHATLLQHLLLLLDRGLLAERRLLSLYGLLQQQPLPDTSSGSTLEQRPSLDPGPPPPCSLAYEQVAAAVTAAAQRLKRPARSRLLGAAVEVAAGHTP